MRQFVDVGRAEQLVSGRRRLPRTSSSSATTTTRERTRPCPAQRSDTPQRSDTRRLTTSMRKHMKRNGALDRRASLSQRSTGRSLRAAEHRFSLFLNNAVLPVATKSPLLRAQTVNLNVLSPTGFSRTGFSRVHRSLMQDVGAGKLNADT